MQNVNDEFGESVSTGKFLHSMKKSCDDGVPALSYSSVWVPFGIVTAYLITWVANCECYQGIANGWLTGKPYDKPVYLTWNAYCYMLLSFLFVYPYAKWSKCCSLGHFYFVIWPGKLSFRKSLLACLTMMYTLIVLNILWVYGLVNISVAAVNAVNQTQAGMTVALSIWWLGDRLVPSEGIGVLMSLLGVSLIVLPPLFDASREVDDSKLIGIIMIIASSFLWAVYQLSWRVLSEAKNVEKLTRLEGLMDTLATLSVMGCCNLFFGWPLIFIFHLTGIENFEFPSEWMALTLNGLVEYSFDASCATAIFLTSPVVTAITAPLTIPISFLWDSLMYNKPLKVESSSVFGVVLLLVGVAMIELKPQLWGETICTVDEKRSLLILTDEKRCILTSTDNELNMS